MREAQRRAVFGIALLHDDLHGAAAAIANVTDHVGERGLLPADEQQSNGENQQAGKLQETHGANFTPTSRLPSR